MENFWPLKFLVQKHSNPYSHTQGCIPDYEWKKQWKCLLHTARSYMPYPGVILRRSEEVAKRIQEEMQIWEREGFSKSHWFFDCVLFCTYDKHKTCDRDGPMKTELAHDFLLKLLPNVWFLWFAWYSYVLLYGGVLENLLKFKVGGGGLHDKLGLVEIFEKVVRIWPKTWIKIAVNIGRRRIIIFSIWKWREKIPLPVTHVG